MSESPLVWSSQYTVAATAPPANLTGDKILLPPSALQQLLSAAPVIATDASSGPHTTSFDPFNPYTYSAERNARAQAQDRQHQLPHPLTFRLVNPDSGRVVYAGIREFSAEEGEIVLSEYLRQALGLGEAKSINGHAEPRSPGGDEVMVNGGDDLQDSGIERPRVTVHAKQLPKGTYVKLRPLEAGYNPEDWKALLEKHLRSHFTTLTNGEVLVVPGGRGTGGKREEFRFLIDGFKPEGDGICVVDTDLEVDIEALNEEQARETLRQIAAKSRRAPGTDSGSSVGGQLNLLEPQYGQVLDGEYVDWEIPSWDRSQGLEIELSDVDEEDEIDLLVSPYSSRQRVRPREDEYVFAQFEDPYPKRIRLQPTNIELEEAEAVWVSVHAYSASDSSSKSPKPFTIRAVPFDPKKTAEEKASDDAATDVPPNPDEVRCKNCHQWVPQRTLFLHENFCLRNNVLCPQGCGAVFKKGSPELANHWHCPHDSFHGNTALSHEKHDYIYHTEQTCPSCSLTFPSLPTLAQHRTSVCPGKLILCRFCHLEVPQEGDPANPSAEAMLSGLTVHELADGGRTTECHLCDRIVRLRDMGAHLKHHDFERLSRPAPRLCRNANCGRTLDGASRNGDTRAGAGAGPGPGNGNDLGLCPTCYGPLYVSLYDPDGKALRRRVERRYLTQLLQGCGKPWCRNELCRTGRTHLGLGDGGPVPTKDALPLIKPYLPDVGGGGGGPPAPLHFCTDEASQTRRQRAEMLAADPGVQGKGGYALEWCVSALEAEAGDMDRARAWLKNFAPQRAET